MVDHGDMIHSKCPLHDIAHEETTPVLLQSRSLREMQPVSFGNYPSHRFPDRDHRGIAKV